MNKYIKDYLLRGLIFSGFGPIIYGIICLIIELIGNYKITGIQVFSGIITTYIIAFVHAGSSVFPQTENISKVKALFLQLISLYSVYTIGYLLNGWIPFNIIVFIIYSSCFIGGFLLIWLIIYLSTKRQVKLLNDKLCQKNNN